VQPAARPRAEIKIGGDGEKGVSSPSGTFASAKSSRAQDFFGASQIARLRRSGRRVVLSRPCAAGKGADGARGAENVRLEKSFLL
jgi:hypothetical protein